MLQRREERSEEACKEVDKEMRREARNDCRNENNFCWEKKEERKELKVDIYRKR